MRYGLVQTQEELETVCRDLEKQERIALDTEFLRVNTYFPKLCLLQVSTGSDLVLIDPVTVDLAVPSLQRLLLAQDRIKVFHAARQDIEVLQGACGRVPRAVFDTQIAAAMLGLGDQIGYAALVEIVVGKTLDKAHTRTDWCSRPLTPQQIEYARDDVRYLVDIYEHLVAELKNRGRLDWVVEECAALSDVALYEFDAEAAYKRMGQGRRLEPLAQGVLKELATWRERLSQTRDLPRGWVVKDSVLVDLARSRPRTLKDLAGLDGISERFARKYGRAILQLIRDVVERQDHPVIWRTSVPLSEDQRALRKKITAYLDKVSREAGVSAGLLGSRQDVDNLVRGRTDVNLMKGWRATLVGDGLNAILG